MGKRDEAMSEPMEDKRLERSAVYEFIRYHHNPIVGQKNTEIATLQSQITALKSQLPEGMEHCTIRFIECPVGHGRLTADNWAKSECLYCQITAIKKLINGASLHPETGVSLIDDVRDLVKEVAGYKAQVAGQAEYIGHLLTEIADYKERVFDYEERIAEFMR